MPPPFLEKVIQQEHDAIMLLFVKTLASKLPGVPLRVFLMRFMFSGGCLIMITSHMNRLNLRKNQAACDAVLKTLVDFVAAGLSSPSPLSMQECGLLPLPPFAPRGPVR